MVVARGKDPTQALIEVPGAIARISLTHTTVDEEICALLAEPARVPDHWFAADADEWEKTLRDPSHRRAQWSATLGLYLVEPFGERRLWSRIRDLASTDIVHLERPGHPGPAHSTDSIADSVTAAESR